MIQPRPTATRVYAAFVGVTLVVTAGIIALAYVPVVRLAGVSARTAMLAGCGTSWLASCVGAIPVALAVGSRQQGSATPILAMTAVRFVAVLILTVPLALSGWFDRTVLVVCIGVSYLLMLPVDTLLAVRMMKRLFDSES